MNLLEVEIERAVERHRLAYETDAAMHFAIKAALDAPTVSEATDALIVGMAEMAAANKRITDRLVRYVERYPDPDIRNEKGQLS